MYTVREWTAICVGRGGEGGYSWPCSTFCTIEDASSSGKTVVSIRAMDNGMLCIMTDRSFVWSGPGVHARPLARRVDRH